MLQVTNKIHRTASREATAAGAIDIDCIARTETRYQVSVNNGFQELGKSKTTLLQYYMNPNSNPIPIPITNL